MATMVQVHGPQVHQGTGYCPCGNGRSLDHEHGREYSKHSLMYLIGSCDPCSSSSSSSSTP
eukprot:1156248-Pelagomonas_calceolata.AAC.18